MMQRTTLQTWMRTLEDPARLTRLAWTVFGAAFCLRLLVVIAVRDWTHPIEWEFINIVKSLLAGNGYRGGAWLAREGPTALYAPVYVFLIYGCRLLFGAAGWAALQFLQCAVGAGAAVLLFHLARRAFDQRVGFLAGLVLAANPAHCFVATCIHPVIWVCASLLAVTLACDVMAQRRTRLSAAVFGAVAGLATLVEPSVLSFVPLAALWPLLTRWREWRSGLRLAAVAAAAAVVAVSPWTVRNWLTFGKLIPVRTGSELILWLGNHPGATGVLQYLDDRGEVRHVVDRLPQELRQKLAEMPEVDAYAELGRMARDYMAAHPGQTLIRTAKKAAYYWWFPFWQLCPRCRDGNIFTQFHHIENIPWVIVLGLAACGTWLWRAQWRRWLLLVMPMLTYTATYAILHVGVNSRYRLPVECLVMAFSGAALAWLARSREKRPSAG
ncbi:MAG: glycosyltransferase family 39 protein [Verrucomicrobia bacterium]|nr:glycosyltransferase family 39 protein [Verrucomicrobiota bacterium]